MIGLALFAVLVWHFGWREMLALLHGVQLLPIAGMILLLLAGFWVRAWKWQYALGKNNNAMGLFFLAKMAGNWSPGRVGELAPLLLRKHRTPRVAAWILTDRVLEVALTLALGLAGAVWLRLLAWPLAVTLSAGALLAALLGFVLMRRPNGFSAYQQRWPEDSRRQRLADLACKLHEEMVELGARAPLILCVTLAAKVTDIYAVVLLCRAFGYNVSFLLVCAARCAHALVSGIPVTPDATGVPYVAAAYLLHEHAGIPYPALTAALGLEVALINLLLWLSFLAGLLDLRERNEAQP